MADPSSTPATTSTATGPFVTALVGATGMVGAPILSTLLTYGPISNVNVFARRDLPSSLSNPHSRLQQIIEKDTDVWHTTLSTLSPPPQIFFSGLATTRAQVGGFENQKKIDLDLNVSLAKAAKEAGVQTYVLISAQGANSSSMLGYPQMKGQLEEEVLKIGFQHTVFLRPGLIGGRREESRPAEAALRRLADFMGGISGGKLKDFWTQDADVIAKAAVNAGVTLQRGIVTEESAEWKKRGVKFVDGGKAVWEVNQSEIMRLGRAEWKDE